ncbi:nitroreductase [Piscinibacter sakaiensis]|uniref:Nitroreductase family protein n=1 Tax=Piscinibacter sakaiensis TaxID=1547922 RepID=A0A0K8P5P7_PISS1|nr:nitroreductase [Piscinibacter sakaiensis]GAP37926.1 nitroreductase family protein [Piscinibacter sakaiensis]
MSSTQTAQVSASRSFGALLSERFSCRGYRPDPVPRATIDEILRLAQRTASWCNSQPWQVIVNSAAATDRLREHLLSLPPGQPSGFDIPAPADYRGVYKDRRRACGLQLYESVGVTPGDRVASAKQARENFAFFGAPHVAIVTTEAILGTYGAVDCGAYVHNFMIAARSLGVASIAQAALAARAGVLREWYDLPAERQVVCGISFGYADPDHPANGFRTARADIGEACRWVD